MAGPRYADGYRCVCLCCAWPPSAASACSCIQGEIGQEFAGSTVIFRGVCQERHSAFLAGRHAARALPVTFVGFRILERNSGVTLRCGSLIRARTASARTSMRTRIRRVRDDQKADDYRTVNAFWYGWLDLLPKGKEFLTVNGSCNPTSPVKRAGNTCGRWGRAKARGIDTRLRPIPLRSASFRKVLLASYEAIDAPADIRGVVGRDLQHRKPSRLSFQRLELRPSLRGGQVFRRLFPSFSPSSSELVRISDSIARGEPHHFSNPSIAFKFAPRTSPLLNPD